MRIETKTGGGVGFDFGGKRQSPPLMEVLPAELCSVPGLVAEHCAYTADITPYPNVQANFLGALSFLSFAAGRRYRTIGNARPNVYLVAVAQPGAGKDAPRKSNAELAHALCAQRCLADSVGSGEGLQDLVLAKAKVLLQYDEFDTLIRAVSQDRTGAKEPVVGFLLSAFTSSGGFLSRRLLSRNVERKRDEDDFVVHPSLTMFATAVPQFFYEALNGRMAGNGFLARCLVANCGLRSAFRPAKWSSPPSALVTKYASVFGGADFNGRFALPDNPKDKRSDEIRVDFTPEGRTEFDETLARADALYHSFDSDMDKAAEQTMYARTGELVEKCAMLYAISREPWGPQMDADAVGWAKSFVDFCQRTMAAGMTSFCAENEFDAQMKKVLAKFDRCGKDLTRREIARALRMSTEDVSKVINALLEQGEITASDEAGMIFGRAKCP